MRQPTWTNALVGVAIAVATLIVWGGAMDAGLIFDDEFTVLKNPDLGRSLPLAKLLLDFGMKDAPSAGRPVVRTGRSMPSVCSFRPVVICPVTLVLSI